MKTLLICDGLFLVLTVQEVHVHLLSAHEVSRYWEAIEMCDDTRAPEVYRAQVYRRVFGSETINALPAGCAQALIAYAEHYQGLHAEQVKGIAACILTGTPFGPDGDNGEGGTREPQTPKRPRSGGGARAKQAVQS